MFMSRTLPVVVVVAALAGCANPTQAPATSPPPVVGPAQEPARASGLLLENFDLSVRPQDDLYRFVNGAWLNRTEIPADKSTYGPAEKLQDLSEANVRAIVEAAAAAGANPGSDTQLIGDFYASFMDEAQAEQLGLAPLEPELARIDDIQDRRQLLAYLGRAHTLGVSTPLAFYIAPDAGRPDVNTVWIRQSGLGMPDRDYYLGEDARFVEMRARYEQHIARVFALAGRKDAADAARRVLAFETRLARASWAPVELRDIDKTYNPFDVAGAAQATPGVDWRHWLESMTITGHDHLIVGQPSYFKEVGKALQDVPLATWQDYLRLKVIVGFSPYLSNAYVQEQFDFYGRTLSGIPQLKPRWKRGLAETESAMGDLLGKEYVARHFPPEAKQRMDVLVTNLLRAFAVSIDSLEWMSADTKREAHDKIASFTVKIGYPEKWKTYPGLRISRTDLVANVARAREVNIRRNLAKLGKPVDKTEWYLTPQTVNAYYNPLANEIVFPAAILQPPFFDMQADDAVNYGAIGAIIGHEISHGFDDQGRKFDGRGALRDWWKAEDEARFKARADQLVKQYDAFSPLPGLHVNGQFTLGENIGDLSGLAVAYTAYQLSLGSVPAPVSDGFTGDQRFFLGYGQAWGRKYRDDEMRRRLLIDPHSPPEYRANGVVRNLPAFHRAFDVKEGDKLYLPPDQVVRIW
jgi:putative endopeptidase